MSHSNMTKGTAKEYFKSLKSEQVGVPCNRMELKREYRVKLKEGDWYVVVINKVVKDPSGTILKYLATKPHFEEKFEFTPLDVLKVITPITATEFFTMYTQVMNMANPSRINYDWENALTLRSKILKTLEVNGYVLFGTGKFEQFDIKRLISLTEDLKIQDKRLCKQCNKVTEHVVFHYTKDKIGIECMECS